MKNLKRLISIILVLCTVCFSFLSANAACVNECLSRKGNKAGKPNSPTLVKGLQGQLKALGLYDGPIDGKFGPQTERAVKAFQRDEKFCPSCTVDGIVGKETGGHLDEVVSEGRMEVSRAVAKADRAVADILQKPELAQESIPQSPVNGTGEPGVFSGGDAKQGDTETSNMSSPPFSYYQSFLGGSVSNRSVDASSGIKQRTVSTVPITTDSNRPKQDSATPADPVPETSSLGSRVFGAETGYLNDPIGAGFRPLGDVVNEGVAGLWSKMKEAVTGRIDPETLKGLTTSELEQRAVANRIKQRDCYADVYCISERVYDDNEKALRDAIAEREKEDEPFDPFRDMSSQDLVKYRDNELNPDAADAANKKLEERAAKGDQVAAEATHKIVSGDDNGPVAETSSTSGKEEGDAGDPKNGGEIDDSDKYFICEKPKKGDGKIRCIEEEVSAAKRCIGEKCVDVISPQEIPDKGETVVKPDSESEVPKEVAEKTILVKPGALKKIGGEEFEFKSTATEKDIKEIKPDTLVEKDGAPNVYVQEKK